MKTITQNIKVELESNERIALNEARGILDKFLKIIQDNYCSSIYFEDYGFECTALEIRKALNIIDVLSDENPIIQ